MDKDLKKHLEIFDKHGDYIYFGKTEKGIFSILYRPAIMFILAFVGVLLFFYNNKLLGIAVLFLSIGISLEKRSHKQGFTDGYKDGWEDGWNRAKGKKISLEYTEEDKK